MLLVKLLCFGILFPGIPLQAQDSTGNFSKTNNVVIELFYRGDSEQSQNAERFIQQLQQRPGIDARAYDVLQDREQLKRLWQLSKQFGYEKAGLPSFFLCNYFKVGFRDPAEIERLLTIKAYIRPGCKHCKAGKEFLDQMVRRWPALEVQYFDVINDPYARSEVQRLASQYRVQVASFPCIQVAGRLMVGFQTAEITGRKIEELFTDRSVTFPKIEESDQKKPPDKIESGGKDSNTKTTWSNRFTPSNLDYVKTLVGNCLIRQPPVFFFASQIQSSSEPESLGKPNESGVQSQTQEPQEPQVSDEFLLPDDVELPVEVQLPDDVTDPPYLPGIELEEAEKDEIEVPVFGRLRVSKIGLPAFTFLIGLVDGFNPCAMWVLIFLLSVLVNIKERKKILIVAGTFVIVSGLAYFVFMAAWFNVFQLIGLLRPVQIGLGVVALIVGAVNVKDFFAFHKGITFSIPESAKPGIYRGVRKIVTANHLTSALVAAIVLAVSVNIVELLCTAGLPALYTEVLTMQNLPTWANYSYLSLYIVAYMLDDAILVAVVVTTLSHRRLQESEGRWLKLLSGVVILLLGVIMIFNPDILL